MGFFVSVLVLFVQYCLWKTLIGSGLRPDIKLAQMITYIAINEVIGALTRGDFANELGVSIQDGSVAMHFLRPASYQLYLFSSFMGRNCYRLFTSSLPAVIICAVLVGLPPPASFIHFWLFIVHTMMGIVIIFELIYITGMLAFWTQRTWFLSWYVSALSAFFGGTIVPLWFYPRILNRLSAFLPFRYISFEGINYFLGKAPASAAGLSISMAMLWVFALFFIGQLLWRQAQKKITINGG